MEAHWVMILWGAFLFLISGLIAVITRYLETKIMDAKNRADEAQKDADEANVLIHQHKTYAAETFAKKDDITRHLESIDRKFDKLHEKLDKLLQN